MIDLKNQLFQPLTLHRRDGTGLHLGPRERISLPEDAVSEEMRRAEARGIVSLTPAAEATTSHEPNPEPPPRPSRKKDQ